MTKKHAWIIKFCTTALLFSSVTTLAQDRRSTRELAPSANQELRDFYESARVPEALRGRLGKILNNAVNEAASQCGNARENAEPAPQQIACRWVIPIGGRNATIVTALVADESAAREDIIARLGISLKSRGFDISARRVLEDSVARNPLQCAPAEAKPISCKWTIAIGGRDVQFLTPTVKSEREALDNLEVQLGRSLRERGFEISASQVIENSIGSSPLSCQPAGPERVSFRAEERAPSPPREGSFWSALNMRNLKRPWLY